MVLVTALLFFLVQPILRYRYLIYVPLNFYAADMMVWLLSRFPRGAGMLRDVERLVAGRAPQPIAKPAAAQ